MRVIVFFDLPVLSTADRRNYSRFRRYLIKNGFIMMQESVYSKLVLNGTAANTVSEKVKTHLPPDGLVQMLKITEKQYAKIELLVGSSVSEYISTTDRMIVL